MPRIAAVVRDEIRQLNLADVISPHVQLTRRGNSIMGLCPFHNEKTPSFHVNENQGFFKCFGCNEGGDAITFVMKYLNLDYVDAITYLCEHFGIELRYENDGTPQRSFKDLKDLHSRVAEYAKKQLYSASGQAALKYLEGRGLGRELIDRFDLGFFPTNPDVKLFEKDFPVNVLTESGIFYEGRYGLTSLFSGRLLFPIRNTSGACIAFSGRTMDPNEKAKYKNSPETPLFSKRRELYNLHAAKDSMRASGGCYIVEGYFDVMRMTEAGYSNTVAIMGTAFTRDQVSQLKRYAEEYNLLLDGDEAGQKAMRDSRAVALEANIYPNVIFLPPGEDPDSFITRYGKETFDKLVAGKEDLLLHSILAEREKGTDANRKFNRFDEVKRMLELVKNPYRREYYTNETSRIFEVNVETLTADISVPVKAAVIAHHNIKSEPSLLEKAFLAFFCRLPEESAARIADEVRPEYLVDEGIRKLYEKAIELCEQGDILTLLINDPELGKFASEVLLTEPHEQDIFRGVNDCKIKILENYNRAEQDVLQEQIREQSDFDIQLQLLKEKVELVKKNKRSNAVGRDAPGTPPIK